MKDTNTLVEILLATYNGAKYLSELLDSIVNQTYKNIRILIHDDGSTDETRNIIKEYTQRYPDKITFIDDGVKTNGSTWNFEHLMKFSTAERIMFADQDDVWLPEKVEISLNNINELEKVYGNQTPLLVYTTQ
ncbi:MAG: glycosyltransferase [Brevinematia bacterium]